DGGGRGAPAVEVVLRQGPRAVRQRGIRRRGDGVRASLPPRSREAREGWSGCTGATTEVVPHQNPKRLRGLRGFAVDVQTLLLDTLSAARITRRRLVPRILRIW